jgi:hypothetical protein
VPLHGLNDAQAFVSALSDLIGMIYDCAIEPERWLDTVDERSIPTPSGSGRWHATSVSRVLQRRRIER